MNISNDPVYLNYPVCKLNCQQNADIPSQIMLCYVNQV